ncbi:MAG: hypothetical protein RIA69_05600 [Cyclobacteriaceae bacterium]
MSQIVYVSLRNTLIGKGNFGKPMLLDTVLNEHTAKELYDMGVEGNVSFFNEDGDTIELDAAIVQLKMMINVGAANVEEIGEMLMLYHRDDLELIEDLQFRMKDMKNINLITKSIKFDDIETIHKMIVSSQNVSMLVNGHMELTVSSMLMAYMISKHNNKNTILINATDSPIKLSHSKIIDDIIVASGQYDKSSFIGKRFEMLIEKASTFIGEFQKLSTVNFKEIENLKYYI